MKQKIGTTVYASAAIEIAYSKNIDNTRYRVTKKDLQENINVLIDLLGGCCKTAPTRGRPCCKEHRIVWSTISMLKGIQDQLPEN